MEVSHISPPAPSGHPPRQRGAKRGVEDAAPYVAATMVLRKELIPFPSSAPCGGTFPQGKADINPITKAAWRQFNIKEFFP